VVHNDVIARIRRLFASLSVDMNERATRRWAAAEARGYETAIKVTDAQLALLRIKRHDFHGDWNYTIKPHKES
jgi:hypothetical protein